MGSSSIANGICDIARLIWIFIRHADRNDTGIRGSGDIDLPKYILIGAVQIQICNDRLYDSTAPDPLMSASGALYVPEAPNR